MQIDFAKLRARLLSHMLGLAGSVLLIIIGLFITALSDEQKWFPHPSQQLATAMSYASAILGNAWLHWIGGGIIGLTIGLWLDSWLRRKEAESAPHPIVHTPLPAPEPRASADRIRLVREARELVARCVGFEMDFKKSLESSSFYFDLRPFLSAEFKGKFNAPRTLFVRGGGTYIPALAQMFADEIDRLEAEWGLRETPQALNRIAGKSLTQTKPIRVYPWKVLSVNSLDKDGREFIDLAPENIIRPFMEGSALKASQDFESYKGKWLRLSAKLAYIGAPSSGKILLQSRAENQYGLGLEFDFEWASKLSHLDKGDTIIVAGSLREVQSNTLFIQSCALDET